ncbi:MAG: trehalose 6-phosphate synthase [Deltaproteobacteria bacterium]|nr:MAG: trehalose 6-phosphate synthase [Deltaproteobacteria bacterium]
MAETDIERQTVQTLKQFYLLMDQTAVVRRRLVVERLADQSPNRGDIASLQRALESLQTIPGEGDRRQLLIGEGKPIDVDLGYELAELDKDLRYLQGGEARFFEHLAELHPQFSEQVDGAVARLKDVKLNCFITDRDGTINNYCGRYRSSIQSVYNAVFLSRFAKQCTENPVVITSAPLADPGIVNVSVNPEKTLVYAASKGREFIDLKGTRRSYPVAAEKQALLDRLNQQLQALVAQPDLERYSLIGSGFQLKFGQTTIARQDITDSIPADESAAFLQQIRDIVAELDPSGENFVIEDTGLDVEIILTIGAGEGLKDFNKGDAVNYLDRELDLQLGKGAQLVCGDTGSDVPMVEAVMAHCPDTWTVFVTRKVELAERVGAACPNHIIVSEPDFLIATLALLSR